MNAIPVTASVLQWTQSAVRKATKEDLPDLICMGRKFFEESGFSAETSFDLASVSKMLIHLIEGGGVVFVAEKDGQSIGIAAAMTFPYYFNLNCKAGQELFWWLDPQFRGGTLGVRLLKALEAWAQEQGCQTFTMVSLPALDSPASKLYMHRGYRPSECSFIKRMN